MLFIHFATLQCVRVRETKRRVESRELRIGPLLAKVQCVCDRDVMSIMKGKMNISFFARVECEHSCHIQVRNSYTYNFTVNLARVGGDFVLLWPFAFVHAAPLQSPAADPKKRASAKRRELKQLQRNAAQSPSITNYSRGKVASGEE